MALLAYARRRAGPAKGGEEGGGQRSQWWKMDRVTKMKALRLVPYAAAIIFSQADHLFLLWEIRVIGTPHKSTPDSTDDGQVDGLPLSMRHTQNEIVRFLPARLKYN